jgi:hypothetical protein
MPFPVPFRSTALVLACAFCMAGPARAAPPPQLEPQIERLVALLGDSYARGYPKTTMVQAVGLPDGRKLALAIFTIEAYGGGNNHRQYIAVFEDEVDESGPRNHFTLLDVMQIGGKGWRAVPELRAEVQAEDETGPVRFAIPALVNTPGDALNFPSRKSIIRLVFDRRLLEVPAEVAP